MNETSILQYITETFSDIQIAGANGDSFFYFGPEGRVPEKTFPFATLITRDEYDTASNLNRPGVFRLNIGVGKSTYNALLGELPSAPGESGMVNTGHDFTVLDQLMPHPVYGHMSWVCVLNPGENTAETARQLLAEAYQTAVSKQAGRNP